MFTWQKLLAANKMIRNTFMSIQVTLTTDIENNPDFAVMNLKLKFSKEFHFEEIQ